MKWKKLLRNEPCEMPQITSEEDIIAASQLVEADGEMAVEISLFYKGRLRGRYFASRDKYNAYVDGKWYAYRLKNIVRMCKDLSPLKNDYYYMSLDMKWVSSEDKERVLNFLDTWSVDT